MGDWRSRKARSVKLWYNISYCNTHFSDTDIIQPPVSIELHTDEVGSFMCEAICTSFIHWLINGRQPQKNEVVNVTRQLLNAGHGHWITTLWIRGLHDINVSCEAFNISSNYRTSSAATLYVIPGEICKTSSIYNRTIPL